MAPRRVLAIFLDGYEASLEHEMRRNGELPALEALAQRARSGVLEHGAARRTGLAGEHLATGQHPESIGRFAAVDFDPVGYVARQEGTRASTFVSAIDAPTVVFDVPYFDLASTPNAQGVVNWGAHDPGVPPTGSPDGLLAELEARFGRYPAPEHLYGTPWASADACRRMGEGLVAGVEVRNEASLWLLRDRLPDWQLAIVSVSESHSGIEGLWHGIDPQHRLAGHASAPAAGRAVRDVYRAIDRLVGAHVDAFPDATVVVFALHGMGSNLSDVASMALLPELLHRHAKGASRLDAPAEWQAAPAAAPPMEPGESWSSTVRALTGGGRPGSSVPVRLARGLARRVLGSRRPHRPVDPSELAWMPATRYADAWPTMPAFALPSFYDGRIRVNLVGREANGQVTVDDYEDVLDELEALVRNCTDPHTGASVVDASERTASERGVDPRTLSRTDADLTFTWNAPLAFDHPVHGLIGPLPFRRTGGHSGPDGSIMIAGPDVTPGDLGRVSAFDVVPTIIDLLGEAVPATISGESIVVR